MWTACSTAESSASTCAFQSGYIEKIDVCGRWQSVLGSASDKKRERNDACHRRTRWRLWSSSGNNRVRCVTTGHDDGEKGQRAACAMRLTNLLHITIETSPELGRGHRAIFSVTSNTSSLSCAASPLLGLWQSTHPECRLSHDA